MVGGDANHMHVRFRPPAIIQLCKNGLEIKQEGLQEQTSFAVVVHLPLPTMSIES